MEELSRKQKEKHNHKWTNILKLAIFFTVMLAPFIAVLSKCLYVLNPNAKDSYSGSTTTYVQQPMYETNEVSTYDDLIEGNVYTFYTNDELPDNFGSDYLFTCQVLSPVYVNTNYGQITDEYFDYFDNELYLQFDNNGYISLYFDSRFSSCVMFEFCTISTFDFLFISLEYLDEELDFLYSYIGSSEYQEYEYVAVEQSTLDNAFYNAVEDLQNQPLFNWAKNTGIYTTIETMTTGLGMSNTIAMLLAYWSICTAVYIVFDIIIFTFTKLTHFVNE